MLQSTLARVLKKIVPISLEEIDQYSFMLFGSGGYAKKIYQNYSSRIIAIVEHENRLVETKNIFSIKCLPPKEAKGNVLIGSDIGNFQFNQLKALANSDHSEIEKILLLDPYIESRNIEQQPPDKTILLLEHASGVSRHGPLLDNFKRYLNHQGLAVTSLCPLTLYYYPQYTDSRDVIFFSGQRELYDIGRDIFKEKRSTYMEYGFFPQYEHFYMDKIGVNQDSSLMVDDLDWVEKSHLQNVEKVKKHFLINFRHEAANYVLVPLQVPDDPNIMKCSRFKNGMQEFIDYIVAYYPTTESIVFKAHPKDPYRKTYNYWGKTSSEVPFLELLSCAKHVHGITSSTLYEAVLAGVDVILEGNSILAQHTHQKHKLLAAIIDRQVSIMEKDMSFWLQRYSNIQ